MLTFMLTFPLTTKQDLSLFKTRSQNARPRVFSHWFSCVTAQQQRRKGSARTLRSSFLLVQDPPPVQVKEGPEHNMREEVEEPRKS